MATTTKRCVMEARLAGAQASGHQPSWVDRCVQAMEGAAETLQQTLLRTLRRLEHAKGRTYAGEQDDYSSDVADEVDDMDDDTDDPSDIKS
ncbi:MAG: hypothetical protein R3C56_19665 [Pirellulaceae bacterium]